jgi:hypothetical protein
MGQAKYESFNLRQSGRSTRSALLGIVPLVFDGLAVPTEKGVGGEEGKDFLEAFPSDLDGASG